MSSRNLPGFNVIRCWKFGSLSNPARLLNAIRQIESGCRLVQPCLLHLRDAGQASYRICGSVRSRTYSSRRLLHAYYSAPPSSSMWTFPRQECAVNASSALALKWLPRRCCAQIRFLCCYPAITKRCQPSIAPENVLLGTHGTFAPVLAPPDFSKRGNPDQRILAFGHWGTYKRLETLMQAFPLVLKKAPRAKLVVAGANHYTTPGYWESIRAAQPPPDLPIEFRGYVPEETIPELFQTASVVVLPYDSATGSSGPAHQACEFGVPHRQRWHSRFSCDGRKRRTGDAVL